MFRESPDQRPSCHFWISLASKHTGPHHLYLYPSVYYMPPADKASLRTKTEFSHALLLWCQVSSDRMIIAALLPWGKHQNSFVKPLSHKHRSQNGLPPPHFYPTRKPIRPSTLCITTKWKVQTKQCVYQYTFSIPSI